MPSRTGTLKTKVRVSSGRRPPIIHLVFLISGPFDSSGRNTVWNFTSSVFMNFGGVDTTLHPQFFRAVTFESQSLTEEKRSWSIWQPPMLPFWNFITVPRRLTHVAPHFKVMLVVANLTLEECGDFRPTCSSTSSAPILSSQLPQA